MGYTGKHLTTLIDAPQDWKVSQCFWIQSIVSGGTSSADWLEQSLERSTLSGIAAYVKDFFSVGVKGYLKRTMGLRPRGRAAAPPLVDPARASNASENTVHNKDQGPCLEVTGAAKCPLGRSKRYNDATLVIFDARLIPPAPGGKPSVGVDFLVDLSTLSAPQDKDGQRAYDVEFHAAAYTPDGKVAAHQDVQVKAALKPQEYATLRQQGMPFHTQLDLPPGRYQIRLAVRDLPTGYLGTTGIPLILSGGSPAK